jgi:EmrB/QacA subfamily drug resistance transporter
MCPLFFAIFSVFKIRSIENISKTKEKVYQTYHAYGLAMGPVAQRAYGQRWISLTFLCISLLVLSLNNNILNVALPTIARDLHATASQLQWLIDAYILVFAALLLTMGSLGDRYGRKSFLLVGLALFVLGSMLAGLTKSVFFLILLRGFMGIAGAIIMPATLSILSATFGDPKERSQAIALWAATFGLGIGIGPLLGGWLLVHYSWNSIFFANIPVIATAFAGSFFYVSNSKDEQAPPADLPGVGLSIIGLVALLYGIIQAGVKGWTDLYILISLGLAMIFLAAFGLWERRAKNAMLPLYLFKNKSFSGANLALTMDMFALFGCSFFLSQYLQTVLGYSAFMAGLALLPLALIVVITSALSAKIAERLGIKIVVAGSLIISAVGLLVMTATSGVDTTYTTLLIGMAIIGIGTGTATGPATDSVMGAVPISKAGVGSAMNDTTRELGGALGVAVLGTILNHTFLERLNNLTILQILPSNIYETIRSGIEGAHQFATYIPLPQVQERFIVYVDDAFISGMKEAMVAGAAVMVLTGIVTYIILPAQIERADEVKSTCQSDSKEGLEK